MKRYTSFVDSALKVRDNLLSILATQKLPTRTELGLNISRHRTVIELGFSVWLIGCIFVVTTNKVGNVFAQNWVSSQGAWRCLNFDLFSFSIHRYILALDATWTID